MSRGKDVLKVASTLKVDDAVGVSLSKAKKENSEKKWYVAIVGNRTEKVAAVDVRNCGFESYVPTRIEEREWRDGSRHKVEQILIPSRLFVFCTEDERLKHVVHLPRIKRFLTVAASSGVNKVAVVPDADMDAFRKVVEYSKSAIFFESSSLRVGDEVTVKFGSLKGLKGKVVKQRDNQDIVRIALQFGNLGYAVVSVEKDNVEKQTGQD